MLKPFLIRDFEEDSQHPDIIEDTASDLYNATDVSVGPQRRHGLVQLAAEDYDEIAYIHPQARLTYLDEDDGETITVSTVYPNNFVSRSNTSSFRLAHPSNSPSALTSRPRKLLIRISLPLYIYLILNAGSLSQIFGKGSDLIIG
jgi:hypothetical protein